MAKVSRSSFRHITWENFLASFVARGDEAVHPVPGDPTCFLFVGKDGSRVGLRIACDDIDRVPALPFVHVQVAIVHMDGRRWLEISSDTVDVFEPFYAMLVGIADLVQVERLAPIQALETSADKFSNLFDSLPILSEEKQVGLWCELWVLAELIGAIGTSAVELWIGPSKEPHDFRIGTNELEVKGTRKEIRSHVISSMSQLVASPERELFLVSIQVGLAGNKGTSLAGMVQKLSEMLGQSETHSQRFSFSLKDVGYIEEHQHFYTQKYQLRSVPEIVLVDDNIPRVTPELLEKGLPSALVNRIEDVRYTVDVTGLGVEWAPDVLWQPQEKSGHEF